MAATDCFIKLGTIKSNGRRVFDLNNVHPAHYFYDKTKNESKRTY